MQTQIADVLGISSEQVSVKAKTMERLGIIGLEEAIAAEAIAAKSSCLRQIARISKRALAIKSAIGKWTITGCCACRARSAALRSNGSTAAAIK